MAFYDGIPVSTNQVLSDVSQMEDNFAFLKAVFQNFCTTWSNSSATGIAPKKVIRAAKTADYTVTAADTFLSVSGASAAVTITLEASATAGAGRFVMVKATDITNTVTIDGNGSETIDGSTTFVFTHTNQAICVISNGSNWEILFNEIPSNYDVGQNLITNSGFGVWSNSDGPHNYGTTPLTGWSNLTYETFTSSGVDITSAINSSGTGGALSTVFEAPDAGHLWKVVATLTLNSGQAPSLYTADIGQSTVAFIGSLSAGVNTFIFKTVGTERYLNIYNSSSGNWSCTFTLYEVTPGCTGANLLAFDGWSKDTTVYVYREPNGSNTKDGSYYALKMTPSAANDWIRWNPNKISDMDFVSSYLGRTFTAGVWVKTSTASHARIRSYDDQIGSTFSSYHSGGGGWEWLESTVTIDSNSTQVVPFEIYLTQSSGDVYVSQPMLKWGESIGEGNYSAPAGEIFWLETASTSPALTTLTSQSDVSDTNVFVESDSGGKLPNNIESVMAQIAVNDSQSASVDSYLRLKNPDHTTLTTYISCYGLANDTYARINQEFSLGVDGDFNYLIEASGSGTFDVAGFTYMAVKLR